MSATTTSPAPGAMIGRADEQQRLAEFVTAGLGRALVLRGETGVGKTALLDHAAGLALGAGQRVIRATGIEAESGLPYAGLHQLVHPLLADAHRLDDGSRAVFDAVFGYTEGGRPPSVMALGIAVLALLSQAAGPQPLLLVLDDGQWLDDASTDVCGFVGRRLAGSPVTLLAAARTDVESRFDATALPEFAVRPLPEHDAAVLLDHRHPHLSSQIRRLVLEQAQGNPLALLELPAHFAGGTGEDMPEDLFGQHAVPVPRRLQHLYGTRISALSSQVRAELLMGALDGAGGRPGEGACAGARYRMRDADEAVSAGLLDVEPGTGDFTFRHPLVRSTVVQMATPNQRRAAHQALARVHRDHLERRATHLAAATVDPDEDVADILEAAAESVTRRGGALAAVSWLTRAAELSLTHAGRSRRLADAAFIAGHAAQLGQAHRLVLADPYAGPTESPAAVLASAYQALYQNGDYRSTWRQVTAAIEALRDGGAPESREMLVRLSDLLLCMSQYAGDAPAWERTIELLASLGDVISERTWTFCHTWSDVVRSGAAAGVLVEQATGDLPELEPWEVTRLGVAAYHLDVLSQYRPHLQRVVDRELQTGAAASGIVMLHLIMLDQLAVGEWDEAEQHGRRALDLAVEHGLELFAMQSRGYLGHLAALRGQVTRARDLQAEVDAWARPRGLGFLTQLADAGGALAALNTGDYETAYLYAVGVTAPGTFQPFAYQAPRMLLDLVEAARHTGRAEQARQHALAARDAGLPQVSPRLALLTYGALAMTADSDQEADEMFARAEAHPDAARFPFDLARVRLAHGIRVRHVKGRVAARQLLVQAAEAFDRLGAEAWAQRAHLELRATGSTPRASILNLASLTWQERRIADLAASGLTNKEIGKRMHLSPRTVSSHLYRIFPKLGITTRAALRDALSRSEGDSDKMAS